MQNTVEVLADFIKASKKEGASDDFLASLLIRRGWPEGDVYSALGEYWQQVTGLSIPERFAHGESSRDAFLYLLAFSTLATWSSALGSMLFVFIDRWFPDPVAGMHAWNLRSQVTWQMASVAVAFPIFALVMRIILGEAQQHPECLESGVRKWLTYIALLLTAAGVICDLIWFFDYFLTGELTIRFVLKAMTVLLICGAIFVYYLGSLRWNRNTEIARAKRHTLRFGVISTSVLVTSFCIGLGVAGTPSMQRQMQADARRLNELRGIAFAIHSWYTRSSTQHTQPLLPVNLANLVGHGVDKSQITDPETHAMYDYHPQSGTTYNLCATFNSAEEETRTPSTGFWHYGKGQTCFTLDASETSRW